MKQNHTYQPPRQVTELPPALLAYLDGNKLRERVGEAIRLTTVDDDGWPHAALLSVGEILAIGPRHLRFVIDPHSTTTKNIERTGRVTLTLVHEGGLWEIRLGTHRSGDAELGHNTAIFTANVELARIHEVPYADVVAGVTYRLKDPDTVIERWEHQIRALRAAS